MGKQAVNKYKVTIAKNTKLSIDEQVKKAFDFLSVKLGIDFDISIQDTAVTPTLREMYKLPNGQMRYTANQIDSDIFIYEQEASYKNGFVTGYTFPTGKITLPVSQLDITSDWLWKVISHEMIHRFEKQLAEKGKPVVDEMDNTFVAGKLVPYYKNDTPEAKDGNYSVMFKKLLPLVPYLVETEQTKNILKRGSVGQDVVKLQKDLNILGFYSGVYLPIFGPATEKAVMNLQVRNKLLADGIVGTKTLALIELLKKNSTNFGLKPLVARLAQQFIEACKAQGEEIKVTEGYRSIERQNELYNQKPKVTNAKGGQSLHQFGVAFDVIFTKTGYKGNWAKIGKIGQSLGLEWGGSWASFKDLPHFQYTTGYKLKSFQQNTIDWSKFE